MVRRFGKVMSFSGRLSNSSTNVNSNDAVIPLSMSSTSSWDLLWHQQEQPETRSPTTLRLQRSRVTTGLAEELVKCRAAIVDRDKVISEMRQDRNVVLTAICRQLLELECGLRKKEKELTSTIQQKDKVIREQAFLIRMLSKKTGTKRSDIRQLCNEAKSKIPQVNVVRRVEKKGLDDCSPFNAIEDDSCSENDTDSAIVLDDERLRHSSPEMSNTLPRNTRRQKSAIITRSASTFALRSSGQDHETLMTSFNDSSTPVSSPHLSDGLYDDDPSFTGFDTAHYRGFLLRHGSYERYKSRMTKINGLENQVNGVCTLPRLKTNSKTGVHLHIGDDLHQSVGVLDDISTEKNTVLGFHPHAKANKLTKSESDLRIASCSSSYKSVIRCGGSNSLIKVNENNHTQTKTCGKNSATVVLISPDQQESPQPFLIRAQTNHRRITKPRDVKNRSKTTKLNMASRSKSKLESNAILTSKDDLENNDELQHFVKKSGSVYCSIFLSSDDSYSFA